ncbi:hypothetical protein Enr13x_63810 [Stieleria neptunia]|uniref:Uncharacterized protein n=1 Tax=Stieleria neptunia TaxID=2527979 RepID=A0A518I064_9BACT|nr:hypothetical protein [Stieleria neptunia]QDV46472.1 hypothetical protein Enr13x_63810 [Stieleria neptunia]
MWLTAPNRIGIAAWQVEDSVWRIEARGGRDGVALHVGDQAIRLVAQRDQASDQASDQPGNQTLPRLDEQFVRGDELHLSFPQSDDRQFGFRLVVRPVEWDGFAVDRNHACFELLVSIQTTLLDAHPSLDLVLPAREGARVERVAASGCRVHHADDGDSAAAVLLGPQDVGGSGPIDPDRAQRVTLFGDFLEKGVIRRARPWLIVNRSGRVIEAKWIGAAIDALTGSPLPLS